MRFISLVNRMNKEKIDRLNAELEQLTYEEFTAENFEKQRRIAHILSEHYRGKTDKQIMEEDCTPEELDYFKGCGSYLVCVHDCRECLTANFLQVKN